MFPFSGKIRNASNTNHYTASELQEFLKIAIEKYDFEIIPLIQTFGHLEFLLKLSQFRKYREVDLYPQEICPSNQKGKEVVSLMMEEMIEFHQQVLGNGRNKLKYIHIGCDEVFHLGVCDRCRGKGGPDLFLGRVREVALEVEQRWGLRPIIWDDMLRRIGKEEMEKSGIGKSN